MQIILGDRPSLQHLQLLLSEDSRLLHKMAGKSKHLATAGGISLRAWWRAVPDLLFVSSKRLACNKMQFSSADVPSCHMRLPAIERVN